VASPKLAPALLIAAVLGAFAAAAPAAVAPATQAATFQKVFGFDRALEGSSLQVLILGREPAAAGLAELRLGFERAGIRAAVVSPAELGARLGAGVVVYLSGEQATAERLDQLARARVLTITGDPALVEAGRAAVGLEDVGGRTQIVVHPGRLGAEGHAFEAQMMRVARVVRAGGGAGAAAPAAPSAPAAGPGNAAPPVLVGFQKPAYPEVARRLRVQGDVVMRLHVDAQGKVTEVEVVTGVSETAGIDEAAVSAARGARFRHATLDGRPVASTYLLTLPFRL
jgi:TonB family protein